MFLISISPRLLSNHEEQDCLKNAMIYLYTEHNSCPNDDDDDDKKHLMKYSWSSA